MNYRNYLDEDDRPPNPWIILLTILVIIGTLAAVIIGIFQLANNFI